VPAPNERERERERGEIVIVGSNKTNKRPI